MGRRGDNADFLQRVAATNGQARPNRRKRSGTLTRDENETNQDGPGIDSRNEKSTKSFQEKVRPRAWPERPRVARGFRTTPLSWERAAVTALGRASRHVSSV